MNLPSASKLALAEKCPGSHTLVWPEQKESSSAKKGKRIHSYLEHRVANDTIDWKLLDIPPHLQKFCKALDVEGMLQGIVSPRAEVSYAWSLAESKARRLGERLGRDYPRTSGEIYGTADVVGFCETHGHPVVVDFKTGKSIGPVEQAWQMRILALMVANVTGWTRCEARVVYIDWYSKFTVESHMFDVLDLDADDLAVNSIVDSISVGEFNEGEHCERMYCPGISVCPLKGGSHGIVQNNQRGPTPRRLVLVK